MVNKLFYPSQRGFGNGEHGGDVGGGTGEGQTLVGYVSGSWRLAGVYWQGHFSPLLPD